MGWDRCLTCRASGAHNFRQEDRKEASQNDWIEDRERLLEADYGKIAIYIMLGIQTFDTCLEMTQGMAHSWREES
jgi:hypothetical protein